MATKGKSGNHQTSTKKKDREVAWAMMALAKAAGNSLKVDEPKLKMPEE